MLERQRFERARILLSEPSPVFAAAARSVLHGMGFRQFFQHESLTSLRAELSATTFDVWICNATLRDGPVFELISDLRHSRIGRDMFIPVVVQSLDVTQAVANETLNAGADLLWRLPTTGGQITDGIDMLVNRRRPFVVTCDYIGPDRRSRPRSGGMSIPLIDVPNPLRSKTQEDAPPVDPVQVMRQINQQKVEAQAFQIGWLTDRIVPMMRTDPHGVQALEYVKRLHLMAKELMGRVTITKYLHQSELCRALMRHTHLVVNDASPRNLTVLKELVKALRVAFHIVDDRQAETALVIAQQVQKLPDLQKKE